MFEHVNEATARLERDRTIEQAEQLARHLPEPRPPLWRLAIQLRERRTRRSIEAQRTRWVLLERPATDAARRLGPPATEVPPPPMPT